MPASIQSASFAALAFALVLAWPARAEVVNLKATMDAKSEVPPNSSPATGTLTATYDTSSKKLSWKGSYSGLTGPATAAHFHSGEAGKNGPVAVPITPATSPFEGLGHTHRRAGKRPAGRKALCQRAYGSEQGRRNPRPGDEVNVPHFAST
jgi:hypothetical protein